jgi:arylsulfatase A
MTRNKNGPFFLYYPMILPHWPFEPTPDSEDWDLEVAGVPGAHGDPKYFADMVAYADKMVGKITAHLDKLGIRENTLVLFTSDNGTYEGITSRFNGRDYRGGKGTMSNAGTHVPLIASWPGTVPAGGVNDDLVDFSDFLPTLAELARVKLPKRPTLDGRSFAPQLLGKPGVPREWIYCWYYPNGRVGEQGGGESARTRRYKLYPDGRFYDLLADELEETPLALEDIDVDARAARQTLQAVLDRHTRKRSTTSGSSR